MKHTYEVTIHFINLPNYRTTVESSSSFNAVNNALKEHRNVTGCGTDEMYDTEKTTARVVRL